LPGSVAARGRRTEASNLFASVNGWFTEGFDTADLKEAKALLDEPTGEVSAKLPRYAPYLAGATVRATYGRGAAAKTVSFPTAESCGRSQAVRNGTRERIEAGTCLVEHDRMMARLSVIASGKADVRLDGEKIAELGDGQFVGQIAYITGEKDPVSIIAKGSIRIISWSRVKLETFFKDRPDVELQLRHSRGAGLTRLF
jgi:hypothetical protein